MVEDRASISIKIATVEKIRPTRKIEIPMIEQAKVVPVQTPSRPSPAKPEKWGHGKAHSKIDPWPIPPDPWDINPAGPRQNWIAINDPRIVGRHVNHIRVDRLDDNIPTLVVNLNCCVRFRVPAFWAFLRIS